MDRQGVLVSWIARGRFGTASVTERVELIFEQVSRPIPTLKIDQADWSLPFHCILNGIEDSPFIP